MKPHKYKIQTSLTLIRLIGAVTALTLLSGCQPVAKDAFQDSLLKKPSFRIHLISRDVSNWLGVLSYQEELAEHEAKNKLNTEEQTLVRGLRIADRLIEQAFVLYPFSKSWEWNLNVLASNEFNASCRAGGKMIVNSYILEDDRFNDHQVALVIGHEIAHALLEHSRSMYGRYAVTVGGGFVLSQSFKMGQLRRDSLYRGIESLSLPIDRNKEREADLLGLALMTKAGFDPVKGASIWHTISDVPAGSKISTRLELYESGHPSDQERLEFLSKTASQFAQSKMIHK
jgi:Zn-dependent protease with chaperone function